MSCLRLLPIPVPAPCWVHLKQPLVLWASAVELTGCPISHPGSPHTSVTTLLCNLADLAANQRNTRHLTQYLLILSTTKIRDVHLQQCQTLPLKQPSLTPTFSLRLRSSPGHPVFPTAFIFLFSCCPSSPMVSASPPHPPFFNTTPLPQPLPGPTCTSPLSHPKATPPPRSSFPPGFRLP